MLTKRTVVPLKRREPRASAGSAGGGAPAKVGNDDVMLTTRTVAPLKRREPTASAGSALGWGPSARTKCC
jgi:hypothetical protein